MKAVEKWWPHLFPKVKRIVSVTFEDGATIQVDDAELRVYLKRVDDERENTALRRAGLPPIDQTRAMISAAISVEASDRASKPRNSVTKSELVAFRDHYEKENGKMHGWKAAACRQFLIDPETLNNRIAE